MKSNKKGFIPVMLTPYSSTGTVDYDGLSRITEFYLESGAVGLFANCLSSEMYELTPDERLLTTRHVLRVVEGQVPVVATGNFGRTLQEQADFVKRMGDTGVAAVILVTGLLAGEDESDEVFLENAFTLMDRTAGIPVGFYECPLPYKRILKASQLSQLLETNRVIYHKDTCLDIEQVREKIAVARGYDFALYDAYLGHAVASLAAGSDGLSCIQGNFFPEIIVWLCEHFNDPDLTDEVNAVQQFLIENMDVMHAVYPPVAKYYLQKRGMKISTYCRTTKEVVDATVRENIDKLFNDCMKLREDIGIRSLSY
ncbi:MAG TPA: dihydrodipicolinate synthase family protein [Cyclobacteriaceae bacterium]|jgi:4-hydroxy-tetrahydrodipicolinate synthase